MLRFAVLERLAASVTFTVKGKLPTMVGVPLITAVLEFKVRPGGKLPDEMLHVYTPVPPVADKMTLWPLLTVYGVLTAP